jgi:hypothetical protein
MQLDSPKYLEGTQELNIFVLVLDGGLADLAVIPTVGVYGMSLL